MSNMPGQSSSSKTSGSSLADVRKTSGGSLSAKKPTVSGWDAVTKKAKDSESSGSIKRLPTLKLRGGEEANIQFLVNDPICLEVHSVKNRFGRFETVVCQLEGGARHCLVCQEGVKKQWKAAFKVLDFRGMWDADRKRWDDKEGPVERVLLANNATAQTILAKKNKSGSITGRVWCLSRTGNRAKDTVYHLDRAEDEDGEAIKPIAAFKEKLPKLSVMLEPLEDSALESMGFEKPDDYED